MARERSKNREEKKRWNRADRLDRFLDGTLLMRSVQHDAPLV